MLALSPVDLDNKTDMEAPTPNSETLDEAKWPTAEHGTLESAIGGLREFRRKQLVGEEYEPLKSDKQKSEDEDSEEGKPKQWISAEMASEVDGSWFRVSTGYQQSETIEFGFGKDRNYYFTFMDKEIMLHKNDQDVVAITDNHMVAGLTKYAQDIQRTRGADNLETADFTAYTSLFNKLDEMIQG